MTEEYLKSIADFTTKEEIKAYTKNVLEDTKNELQEIGIEFTENDEFVPNQAHRLTDDEIEKAKSYDEIQYLHNYLNGKRIDRIGNIDATGGKWPDNTLANHFTGLKNRFSDLIKDKS